MKNDPQIATVSPDTYPIGLPSRLRTRLGLVMTVIGFLIFLLGARPSVFGLDRSPVIGFVQIAVFLTGMAILCLGGYICLVAFWKNEERSIVSEIGSRLAASGYVVVFFAAMSDSLGITQKIMYFGPWQAAGVQLGEFIIGLGFLLLIPFRHFFSARKPKENLPG